jgi:hypothetical protein
MARKAVSKPGPGASLSSAIIGFEPTVWLAPAERTNQRLKGSPNKDFDRPDLDTQRIPRDLAGLHEQDGADFSRQTHSLDLNLTAERPP